MLGDSYTKKILFFPDHRLLVSVNKQNISIFLADILF